MSLLFKAMGKSVTYHDGLRFNEDVGRTVLADSPALSRVDVEKTIKAVKPCSGIVSKNFAGIFFKRAENAWLDGFAKMAIRREWPVSEHALLHYLIYQACLKKRPFNLFHRANLRLRTNNAVTRSFGNAVTWNRSFVHHALQAYDELHKFQMRAEGAVSILPSGDAARISAGYDLVYIDPPYVNREDRYNRDNYWRRYNFLEGLSQYRQWAMLIDVESDIRMFTPPQWFNDWSRARSFKERLFSFVDHHKHSIVVLSYVSGAIPSESEIKAHFKTRFTRVVIRHAEHNHALSKERKRELLFIGYP